MCYTKHTHNTMIYAFFLFSTGLPLEKIPGDITNAYYITV